MNAIARAPGPARLLGHASDDADDLTVTIAFLESDRAAERDAGQAYGDL
jgi:hypothetical protein